MTAVRKRMTANKAAIECAILRDRENNDRPRRPIDQFCNAYRAC